MNRSNVIKCATSAILGGYAVHTAYKIKGYIEKDKSLDFELALVKSLSSDIASVKGLIDRYFSTVNYN